MRILRTYGLDLNDWEMHILLGQEQQFSFDDLIRILNRRLTQADQLSSQVRAYQNLDPDASGCIKPSTLGRFLRDLGEEWSDSDASQAIAAGLGGRTSLSESDFLYMLSLIDE